MHQVPDYVGIDAFDRLIYVKKSAVAAIERGEEG
jgi:hypothetical protein